MKYMNTIYMPHWLMNDLTIVPYAPSDVAEKTGHNSNNIVAHRVSICMQRM